MIAFLLFSSCFEVSIPAAVSRIWGIVHVLLSTATERSLSCSQRLEHHSLVTFFLPISPYSCLSASLCTMVLWPLEGAPASPVCHGETEGQLLPLGVTHISVPGQSLSQWHGPWKWPFMLEVVLGLRSCFKARAEEMSRPKVETQTGGMVAQLENPRRPKQESSKVAIETKSGCKTESKSANHRAR